MKQVQVFGTIRVRVVQRCALGCDIVRSLSYIILNTGLFNQRLIHMTENGIKSKFCLGSLNIRTSYYILSLDVAVTKL